MDILGVDILNGCGNHCCKVIKPIGQGTNSGCTCIPRLGILKRIEIEKELIKLGYPRRLLNDR